VSNFQSESLTSDRWFYQFMVDIFESKIKSIVEGAIQTSLVSAIQQLMQDILANEPTSMILHPCITVVVSFSN
jgi:hypothetical protein